MNPSSARRCFRGLALLLAVYCLTYAMMREVGKKYVIPRPRMTGIDSFPYVRIESSVSHWVFRPADRTEPTRGDYVALSGMGVPWLKEPQKLIKMAACIPGDVLVVLAESEYFCRRADGKTEYLGRAVKKTPSGLKFAPFMPNWSRPSPSEALAPVPEGQLFVVGSHKYSYDSRYFGFVEMEGHLVQVLRPVF